MYGKSKFPGFSFIEVIIVLLIIAFMGSFVLPRVTHRSSERIDTYISELSRLTRTAYFYAIMTGKIHRILFHMQDSKTVTIERATGATTSKGERIFEKVQQSFTAHSITVDPMITIQNFFIKGVDEAIQGTLKEAWFYIFPLGITQDVILNIRDTESGEERGLVLNPFSVKFTSYDTMQKP